MPNVQTSAYDQRPSSNVHTWRETVERVKPNLRNVMFFRNGVAVTLGTVLTADEFGCFQLTFTAAREGLGIW